MRNAEWDTTGGFFHGVIGALALAVLVYTAGCTRSQPPPPPKLAAPPAAAPVPDAPKPEEPVVPSAAPAEATEQVAVVATPAEAEPQPTPEPPPEPGERMLLLAPDGPLVLEVHVVIDGQSSRAVREQLIDELLRMGDKEGKGESRWSDAFEHPRFAGFEQAYGSAQSGMDLQRQRKGYDRDSDGQINRYEAERFIAQATGGANIMLESRRRPLSNHSPVERLLDANGDGILAADEWSLAAAELHQHDLDANDLLDPLELAAVGVGDPGELSSMMNNRPLSETEPRALQLGARASWRSILYWLEEDYLAGGSLSRQSFGSSADLFRHLDLDENDRLSREELERLGTAPADVELELRFGRAGVMGPGVSVISVAERLGPPKTVALPGDAGILLELPGLKIQLAARDLLPAQNYDEQAQGLISRLDADQNGYLEQDETERAETDGISGSFDNWDLDGDGKVFAAELADYLARQAPLVASRVRAAVDDQDDPLFWILDAGGDGRLSPRELQRAAERFVQFDRNGDGRLTSDEMPAVVRASFERGDRTTMNQPAIQRNAPRPAAPAGPRWFAAMDRNGDGDLSAGEFLGTAEQFKHLDSNADGFLDPAEADAASAGSQ
jgi:Ca2+-binding EF-hand superfamily protein